MFPLYPQGHCKTSGLECNDLLEQLPALQQLLYRLIGCRVLIDVNLLYSMAVLSE